MSKKRQLITFDEAQPADGQHKKPCSDCPWARTAIPGWLNESTPMEWIGCAHSESRIDCHTLLGAQCAGAAIYRTNVCKLLHDKELLQLPKNVKLVFATPMEFLEHHNKLKKKA